MKYELKEKEIEDILNRFTYHPPNGDQAERYGGIRETTKMIALGTCQQCPDCRERSLALTHLEEFVFWANAAIARHETK